MLFAVYAQHPRQHGAFRAVRPSARDSYLLPEDYATRPSRARISLMHKICVRLGSTCNMLPLAGSHPHAVRLPPPAGSSGGLRWLDAGLTNTQSDKRKGGHKLHPGIHGLDLRDWLIFDDDGERRAHEVRLKEKALDDVRRRPDVLQIDDAATRGAQQEVHALIVEHLRLHDRPHAAAAAAGSRDLEAAARLVPEDLILLRPGDDGQWHAVAAAVCFSFGDLANRIQNAQTMAELHAKVDGYDAELENPGIRIWRLNPRTSR